jgi:hypothetical protein
LLPTIGKLVEDDAWVGRKGTLWLHTLIHRKSRDWTKPDASASALDIPELLLNIFGYAEDKPSLAACARVAKSWFDPAITHLWKELQTIDPLLGILGELRFSDAREWVNFPVPPQYITTYG